MVRNFAFRKNIIVIVTAALLALGIGGTAVTISVSSMPANRVSQYMITAERYLSEQNYEQAIIEFQKILEIEPMNIDAYLGMADAYLSLGDTERALETLRKGLEMIGDQRLQNKIDKILNLSVSSSTSSEPVESTPEIVNMGSVTICGVEYDIATTTNLYLDGNGITNDDLKQITKLTNLTELWLYNNQISDITPLVGLKKLTWLALNDNQISDITPLARLKNLTRLYLDINQISDIKSLAGLTNLTYLNMCNNQIDDITPLAGLANLTTLYLDENQISDITPLAGLTNLTTLHLYDNHISDISALVRLTNLTYLNLCNNQISDITPLAGSKNLTELYLQDNQIIDEDRNWLKGQTPQLQLLVLVHAGTSTRRIDK